MERISRLLLPRPTAPRHAWLMPALALTLLTAGGLLAQAPEKKAPTPKATKEASAPKAVKATEPEVVPAKVADKDRAKPEEARAKSESTEKVYVNTAREISFSLMKRKEGLQVDLRVVRATRGEILKALERIEVLAAGSLEGYGSTQGKWPLKALKEGTVSEDELLSFELSRVSLDGIRKTL